LLLEEEPAWGAKGAAVYNATISIFASGLDKANIVAAFIREQPPSLN
jgi:hypothetical protein